MHVLCPHEGVQGKHYVRLASSWWIDWAKSHLCSLFQWWLLINYSSACCMGIVHIKLFQLPIVLYQKGWNFSCPLFIRESRNNIEIWGIYKNSQFLCTSIINHWKVRWPICFICSYSILCLLQNNHYKQNNFFKKNTPQIVPIFLLLHPLQKC